MNRDTIDVLDRLATQLAEMGQKYQRLIADGKYEEAHALNIEGRELKFMLAPDVTAASFADPIDATLALRLPVAPQNVTVGCSHPHISSLPSVPFSESGGQVYRKEIVRDGQNGDYLMLLDNEPVGFARNYSEADTTLDELIFAIQFESDTPGTDCPSCGDLLCEDATVGAACREDGATR